MIHFPPRRFARVKAFFTVAMNAFFPYSRVAATTSAPHQTLPVPGENLHRPVLHFPSLRSLTAMYSLRHLRFEQKSKIENTFYLAHFLSLHPHHRWGGVFPVFLGRCFHRRRKQKIMLRQPMKNSVSMRVDRVEKEKLFPPAS